MYWCSELPNCTYDVDYYPFDPDPDIAGIGVVIAFVISAWLAFVFVLFAYLSGIVPAGRAVDRHLINTMRALTRLVTRKQNAGASQPSEAFFLTPSANREALQAIALQLNDQQLVTGIAMLTVGFVKHCSITQYHFYVIYCLGLMSFTVYQSTVVILQEYFARHFVLTIGRAFGMVVLFGMLMTALAVVYNAVFLNYYGMSCQCAWDELSGAYHKTGLMLAINAAFLGWGMVSTMAILFPVLQEWTAWIGTPFSFVLRIPARLFCWSTAKTAGTHRNWSALYRDGLKWGHGFSVLATFYVLLVAALTVFWHLLAGILLFVFLGVFTVSEVFSSDLVDVARIFTTLLWSTIQIFDIRAQAEENGMSGDEDDWGFGQIVPLLLLALPLMSAMEIYGDALLKDEHGGANTLKKDSGQRNPSCGASDEEDESGLELQELRSRQSSVDITARNEAPIGGPPRKWDTEERFGMPIENAQVSTNATPKPTELQVDELEELVYESNIFSLWLVAVISGTVAYLVYASIASNPTMPIF